MGKKKHEEGHGGAWKVAYADFVTAMMALFMVLWIIGQDAETVEATAQFFKHPFEMEPKSSDTIMPFESNGQTIMDSPSADNSMIDSVFLQQLAKKLYDMLNLDEEDHTKPVDIVITNDGMRVKIYDRPDQAVFESGSSRLTLWGVFVIDILAWVVDQYVNMMDLRVDAYTNKPKGLDIGYDPLELSAARTVVVRKALESTSLEREFIEELRALTQEPPFAEGWTRPSAEDQRVELSLVLSRKGAQAVVGQGDLNL